MNTRDKRASALGVALAFRLVLPTPGTITQPDRQQVAYCYRGIAADALNTGSVADVEVDATYVTSETVTGIYVTSEDIIGTI